jgi:Fic family protein
MENDQICSDDDVKRLQRRNALLQFDEIRRLAAADRAQRGSIVIDAALVKRLHAFATADIFPFAGKFRDGPCQIDGTSHVPPPEDEVPGLVDDMLRYVVDHWDTSPVHLCSYLLWRCNWIHPFPNGNGRTTRGLAYLVFILRLGYEPGGDMNFIEMIGDNQPIYYAALDAADAAWAEGRLDLSAMEQKVSELILTQLVKIVDDAGARPA